MVDLFEDVEGQLRAEQYKRLALKILPWAAGVLLLALVVGGGYLGYTSWQNGIAHKAAENYEAALKTLQNGDNEGAFNAFGEIAAKGSPIYKSFALTQQAAIRLSQGKDEEAVALFDKSAEAAPSSKEGVLFADLARLKSAWTLLDEAPYADLEARLTPLTETGRPLRTAAQEALAWVKLRDGKTAEARKDFLTLSAALDAPQGLTQRATAVVGMIDAGGVSDLPALVKATKALPAPVQAQQQLPPELIQQLMQQAGAQAGQPQGAPAQ